VSYRGDRSGFLAGRYTRANMPADGRVPLAGEDLEESAARRAVERNFRVVDAATVVAARRGRPIPQVALAWLLAVPGSPRRSFGRALSISLRSCSTQPTWSSAKRIDGCWRRPRRLPRSLLTACCVGKSASQMCLRFAAPGESNGAPQLCSGAQCNSAHTDSGKSLTAFIRSRDRRWFDSLRRSGIRWHGAEKRPLRRQPEDHNFGSLIMLAVTPAPSCWSHG
jgi:hypothetical protein